MKKKTILLLGILLLLILSLLFIYINCFSFKDGFDTSSFIALSYDNSTIPTNTENLEKLFEKNNYNYKIIGKGKQWEGWYGRTQEYLLYINDILEEGNDNYYVLLCDGRDVLINENIDDFIEKAKNICKRTNKSMIFGAERHCCAGNGGINSNDDYKNKMIEIARDKTKYDYYYLNFGLLFGKVSDIKTFFDKIDVKPGETDQSLAVVEFCNHHDNYHLDYDQEIFSNNSGECKLTWDDDKQKFRHSVTNTYPSILHFPGGNWDCYKSCALKLFENADTPPTYYN